MFEHKHTTYAMLMKAKTEQDYLDSLGKRLATIRKAKGVTQEQLASAAGMHSTAIAFIETGARRPLVSTMYKLAEGLKIDPIEFYKDL
jgi:transcriptional regulator with XRE-family HTH domain